MSNIKTLPFDYSKLKDIVRRYPTPFHIYDEKAIRENARGFNAAFAWAPGFRNCFAVKACPNPRIMKILAEENMGADCSSLPELILSEAIGLSGDEIFFSSNNTPLEEYRKAKQIEAIINLDDITHLDYLEQIGLPDSLSFRYNPGPAKAGNSIIGKPEEAKYGLTREQMFTAYSQALEKGVKRLGIHTMVASNELNADYFIETAALMLELIADITQKTGAAIEFVNFGGGIGIPYKPEDSPVDIQAVSRGIEKLYTEHILNKSLKAPSIYFECGRVITGPYGYLVTKAIHEKHTYKEYIGVDASMADLMRPAIYGAYHHITVMGKENAPAECSYDIVGSLCENNDKFAINRALPSIDTGDILVIHDTGAHGRAMGFNYNGKLRAGELLLRENGEVEEIRRRETLADYFSTLNYPGLKG
ncbi:MAG: diaminopimelate decarboxylase [Spirochaeta sp. LUC14_002_19_P3]|nr:MAG: diaminopimelate decarboxylase [Spirochaeta sp. LUC14_002_19_P3]